MRDPPGWNEGPKPANPPEVLPKQPSIGVVDYNEKSSRVRATWYRTLGGPKGGPQERAHIPVTIAGSAARQALGHLSLEVANGWYPSEGFVPEDVEVADRAQTNWFLEDSRSN